MGLINQMKRFDVYLINLDSTVGKEAKKTHPCLIISPDEMNTYISTVIIAPMTARIRDYPSRVVCEFQGTQGQIVLDQIRTVDKKRLIKNLGFIDDQSRYEVIRVVQEMFSL